MLVSLLLPSQLPVIESHNWVVAAGEGVAERRRIQVGNTDKWKIRKNLRIRRRTCSDDEIKEWERCGGEWRIDHLLITWRRAAGKKLHLHPWMS